MNLVKLGLFELKVGDVLLFRTMGRIPSTAVVAGQWMFSRNDHDGRSSTIHAAIYADNEFVLEADGPGGLAYTRLTEKKRYLCQVYRYEVPSLAELAACVAASYVQERGQNSSYGKYSLAKAFASFFVLSSRGKGAIKSELRLWGVTDHFARSTYCSSFVCRCYAAAGQTMAPQAVPIDVDFRHVSPKELQARLNIDQRLGARRLHLGELERARTSPVQGGRRWAEGGLCIGDHGFQCPQSVVGSAGMIREARAPWEGRAASLLGQSLCAVNSLNDLCASRYLAEAFGAGRSLRISSRRRPVPYTPCLKRREDGTGSIRAVWSRIEVHRMKWSHSCERARVEAQSLDGARDHARRMPVDRASTRAGCSRWRRAFGADDRAGCERLG